MQKSIFNPSDPAEDGRFGFAVGVSGNTAVISAPNATVQGTAKVGALYTFNCQDFNGDTWIAGQKLEPIFVQAFMGFGFSLVIEGNTIFTGAPFFDFQGINGTGLTQSFKRTNGVWSKAMHGEYTIPNAQTGMSVALNGADYWYGSPGWDTDKGRVKVGNFNHVYDTDPDLQRHFGRNMAAHNGQFIIAAPGGPHGTVFFGIRD
ncbi:MAG TPA: hypothetical protein VD996_15780 [Chitinophagaceae bacterium]|nr:hypothetical protein [Chitinophagaceae bacterium]